MLGKLFVILLAGLAAASPLQAQEPVQATNHVDGNTNMHHCSEDDGLLHNLQVTFEPAEVVKGGYLTIKVTGTLDKNITDGLVTVAVSGTKMMLPVRFNRHWQLCRVMLEAGQDCPLKAGDVQLLQTFHIPSAMPDEVGVEVQMVSNRREKLICVRQDALHIGEGQQQRK